MPAGHASSAQSARRVSVAALAIGWLALGAFGAWLALYRPPPDEDGFRVVLMLVAVMRMTLAVVIPALLIGVGSGVFAVRREETSRRWLKASVGISALALLAAIAAMVRL